MNRIQLSSLSTIFTLIGERIWVRDPHWVQFALNRQTEQVMTTLSEGREMSEKEAHEPVMLGDSM